MLMEIEGKSELHKPIVPNKGRMIMDAFEKYRVRSFADLGACWGVNAGYSYQAMMSFNIEKAYVVDTHVTNIAKQRAKLYPNLQFVTGEIGYKDTVDQIPGVDAIIMYDMLVHQANPNWDQIIDMYAPKTRVFIIYNQQWTGSEKTQRLIDLGKEAYLKNTPGGTNDAGVRVDKRIDELFDNLDKKHPLFDKKYRDAHNYWQWGITDADLIDAMWRNNFKLEWMKNFGNFYGPLPNFENHGFFFVKNDAREY
ncbi:MAG: hypothetical protein AAF666_08640 [Pseudomonadota bacterium]